MLKFGWDFKKAEEEGKFLFIDATRLTRVAMLKEKMMKEETSSLRGKELQIDRLVEELQEKIQQIGAKRVVLDSITGLMSFCSHSLTFFSKFLQVIVAKTRATESNALFLASPEAHDQVFISYLREIFDGTLEMKMETEKGESGEEIRRLLRLFSLKGAKHKTHWALFEITNKGIVLKSEKEIRCVMCSRQIEWEPHLEIIDGKQYNFDSAECATTYKRLKALYGESFE
jgi:KaiC/GvpD/RAD55 family RecA-like ATPase